jgi:hypothetical protein
MSLLEEFMAFFAVMTVLSIPIVAIISRSRQKADPRMEDLLKRLNELECKQAERDAEVATLRSELSFMHRLLEDHSRKG